MTTKRFNDSYDFSILNGVTISKWESDDVEKMMLMEGSAWSHCVSPSLYFGFAAQIWTPKGWILQRPKQDVLLSSPA